MEQHPKWAGLRKGQRKIHPDLRAELEADIIKAYKTGMDIRQVAHYVNRSYDTVRNVLIKHKVPMRPVGRPQVHKEPFITQPLTRTERLSLDWKEKLLAPINTDHRRTR